MEWSILRMGIGGGYGQFSLSTWPLKKYFLGKK